MVSEEDYVTDYTVGGEGTHLERKNNFFSLFYDRQKCLVDCVKKIYDEGT